MITKITGKLLTVDEDHLVLGVEPYEYEILIPEFTRRQLQNKVGERVSLHTIHYLDGNPAHGRLTPRLIGFLSPVEREFFEMVCSVDGVGAKKALRAMVRPVPEVAALIEEQDAKGLSGLPGVGAATAERIIAKLRRKMPKFALLVSLPAAGEEDHKVLVKADIIRETYDALRILGHSETDARKLIDAVLAQKKSFKDVDSLIRAIYELSHLK